MSDEKTFSLEQMRGAYEHRALWMYYLSKEHNPVEDGADGPLHQAIRQCGLYHAATKYGTFESIDKFCEAFASEPAKSVFEMEIVEKDENTLSVDFHYCPLVEAWKKLGIEGEELAALCDIAMDGDRGIIEGCGGMNFELPATIANGDGVCQIRITTK